MVVETKRVETERPTQAEPASRRSIGARLLCQALEREGVDLIFGYPGGAVIPLYDVLPEFNQVPRWWWLIKTWQYFLLLVSVVSLVWIALLVACGVAGVWDDPPALIGEAGEPPGPEPR